MQHWTRLRFPALVPEFVLRLFRCDGGRSPATTPATPQRPRLTPVARTMGSDAIWSDAAWWNGCFVRQALSRAPFFLSSLFFLLPVRQLSFLGTSFFRPRDFLSVPAPISQPPLAPSFLVRSDSVRSLFRRSEFVQSVQPLRCFQPQKIGCRVLRAQRSHPLRRARPLLLALVASSVLRRQNPLAAKREQPART